MVALLILFIRLFYYFSKPIPYKVGDNIRISSQVTSEPVRYENSQYLKLQGFKIYLPLYPEIYYGDNVVVEGIVELDKKGDFRLKNPRLIEVDGTNGLIYKLRSRLLLVYQKSLPQPHSSLVAGVSIGSKSDISSTFWENLKASGTAHVVVASGMNVTLVAGFLLSFLITFLKRRQAIVMTLAGIWIYTIMAGFDAPIIRAAVMGSIAFTAVGLGRLNDAKRALYLSAYIMLIVNPSWVTDIGFILSFVATASIMYFQKPVQKLVNKTKVFNKLGIIKEDLVTTLAAQVGVAPIIYFTFGQFNIFSPFINAAVLWTIPFITIIGMIGGLVGLIFVPLGKAVLFLTYPMTTWFIGVVSLMG